MRSTYKTMLVVLVVVSAISAVAASSAFAESQWEIKTAGVWKPVASTLEVKATGELEVESQTWGGVEKCHAETSGTIEPHGKGTVTTFVLSACTSRKDACAEWSPRKALHLPWKTELFASGSQRTIEGGSGLPQEEFRCFFSSEETTPYCSLSTTQAVTGEIPNAVREVWERKNEVDCVVDYGHNSAAWQGKLVIKPPTGTEGMRAK